MKHLFFIFLSIVFVLSGCSKEDDLPTPRKESPKLFMTADIDGQSFEVKAGVDGYVMNTNFVQGTIGDSIGFMSGAMTPATGGRLGPKFEFRIRNLVIGTMPSDLVSSALRVQEYAFYDKTIRQFFRTSFTAHSEPTGLNYEWDFGDGSFGTGTNPVHLYANTASKYEVCLSSTDSSCDDLICSDVFMPTAACNAQIKVTAENIERTKFKFEAISPGSPVVVWTLNDSITVYTAVVQYQYPDGHNTIEHLRLHTETSSGDCTADVAMKLRVGVLNSGCFGNFDYTVEEINTQDPGFGAVEIIYTDALGHVYTTGAGEQSNGLFRIEKLASFSQNTSGQKTTAMDVRFSGTLYDGKGGKVEITNGAGRIAIAHP